MVGTDKWRYIVYGHVDNNVIPLFWASSKESMMKVVKVLEKRAGDNKMAWIEVFDTVKKKRIYEQKHLVLNMGD